MAEVAVAAVSPIATRSGVVDPLVAAAAVVDFVAAAVATRGRVELESVAAVVAVGPRPRSTVLA